MIWKLCLHGVRVARPETFSADVARAFHLKMRRGPLHKKEYEEAANARYRYTILEPEHGMLPYRLRIREGVLVVDARLTALFDVEFTYETGAGGEVLAAVRRLLDGSDTYVLAEPDLRQRVKAMRGCAYPRLDDGAEYGDAVFRYLNWQLLGINWYWHLLLEDLGNRLIVRQLRVKIRRLRSCLVFFKGGLPGKEVYRWQQFFRGSAESLSNLRELDVALLACDRMWPAVAGEPPRCLRLKEALKQLRTEAAGNLSASARLNEYTEKAAAFILWLQKVTGEASERSARRYAAKRIARWSHNLAGLGKRYPNFSDMEDLHRIRIKVKRFRYVIQTVDILALPLSLLRQLKQLQDVLGLLHDNYINAIWAEGVARREPADRALQEQVQAFLVRQRAGNETALAMVPEIWHHFLADLKEAVGRTG